MNFNLTFSEEMSEKIILQAKQLDITSTHFIEHLVLSALETESSFDFIGAAAKIRNEVADLVEKLGYGGQFSLNDCPFFKQLLTKNPEIRATIGRNFNKAVRNNSIPHVRRCTFRNGKLKNVNGSAVYEIF